MLFRLFVQVACNVAATPFIWMSQRCSGTEPHHDPDSYVYRYEREVGFKRADAAEEAADARIRAARNKLRQKGDGKIKSHDQRVARFALFERYCLEKHSDHAWSKWLLSLGSQGEKPQSESEIAERKEDQVTFEAPTEGLVTAYAQALVFEFTRLAKN